MDITKIDGYVETMTADEKLALIAKYETPVPDLTGFIKKESFDKTASELAEAKKQLKAKMTEDEQKEAERAAKEAERDAELEKLRKESAVSKSKAKYLSLGYEEKLAEETATALADGDMNKVFDNQAIHLETVKKAAAAEALIHEPTPPAGKGGDTDKEAFEKMTLTEKAQLKFENPDKFRELSGGDK